LTPHSAATRRNATRPPRACALRSRSLARSRRPLASSAPPPPPRTAQGAIEAERSVIMREMSEVNKQHEELILDLLHEVK
jgi:hypothetical protein